MLALILKLLPTILGWFGVGSKDERDVSHDQGLAQGKAESKRDAAIGEIHDIQIAKEARDGAASDLRTSPDKLRQPDKFQRQE